MRTLALIFASSAAVVFGCGDGGAAPGFSSSTQPGVTTAPSPSSSSGGSSSTGLANQDSTSTSSSTSADADSSGGPKLDMAVPDGGTPAPLGCQGKIDFLFVISSHGTMLNQQQRLLEAYPEFMTAIEAEFPDFDRHILVAGDGYWQMTDCSLCADLEDCDPNGPPPGCSAEVLACDKKMGAGVTFPVGINATNRRCNLFGGNRYIVNGEPDPLAAFECIATVGTGGGGTRPAEAMVAALSDDLNGYKRCNDGFLRDDALLVVTIIKDVGDVDSQGDPEDWVDWLYWSKGDDEDAVLLLVLTSDGDIWPSLCNPGEPPSPAGRLRLFANAVKHGYIESICAPSYGPFFADLVSKIRPLCDGLIPQ